MEGITRTMSISSEKLPEYYKWADTIAKERILTQMEFKINKKLINTTIFLGIREISPELIRIIYPTHETEILFKDFDFSYLFNTTTNIKLIINCDILVTFLEALQKILKELSKKDIEEIEKQLELLEAIKRVAADEAAAALAAEEPAVLSKSEKKKAAKELAKLAPVASHLEAAASAEASSAKAEASSAKAEASSAKAEEEYDESDSDDDDSDLPSYWQSILHFVKQAKPSEGASNSSSSSSFVSKKPAPALASAKLVLRKRRPPTFVSYSLGAAILEELKHQSLNRIFFRSNNKQNIINQVFYIFNIDKGVRECIHLTIGPSGVHMTLDLIKDDKKKRHIHFKIVKSRSTGIIQIYDDNDVPITPTYIATKFTSALLELNSKGSGGAGGPAPVDYSFCDFERKSHRLLQFLFEILRKCIPIGALVLANERAGGNYYEKYMKYKTKYLQLKQLMETI